MENRKVKNQTPNLINSIYVVNRSEIAEMKHVTSYL